MNNLNAFIALSIMFLATGPGAVASPSGECRVVHGRYAIYANHDRLWVIGSKHLIDVTVDELDRELSAMGWEDTVVYGDFRLCAERLGDPLSLTVRDRVNVTSYNHLDYRRGR
jgi:hypothetical protein